MQYGEAMISLRKNELKKLYLIAGEEKYLAEKFLNALKAKLLPEAKQNNITKLDDTASVNDIIEACSTMPFFCDKNIIHVHSSLFREKKGKTAEKRELLFIDLLANIPEFTVLILETDEKPDKRRKLYKTIEKYGLVFEAEPVRAYNIGEWLKTKFKEIGKTPDTEAYEYLLATINVMQKVSLGFLDKELDKLALFTERRDIRKHDLIDILSGLPEISAFALAEAAGSRDLKKALALLDKQLSSGVPRISILIILIRHIHQLWKINFYLTQGADSRIIGQKLGLVPFIAEKLIVQAKHFELHTLRETVSALADADYKLKTGQNTPVLFEDILIRLCR
ncbi:DNA polymerase III subunit delta [Pectinatus haikarae]|uniref:DNA polymerase III subunit delta n=1 Tax=Pectinatus haikarae TaxID=349096 RepID=UPI0018C76E4A|nr:DNA polymerase III subunit delta [Pectinatus haikarae]